MSVLNLIDTRSMAYGEFPLSAKRVVVLNMRAGRTASTRRTENVPAVPKVSYRRHFRKFPLALFFLAGYGYATVVYNSDKTSWQTVGPAWTRGLAVHPVGASSDASLLSLHSHSV